MRPRGVILLLCLLVIICAWGGEGLAQAPTGSCYATPAGQMIARRAPPSEAREIVILIDQTVDFPSHVVQQVRAQALRLARPGHRITIGSFSADSRETYPAIHHSLLFESAIPSSVRADLPRRARDEVEQCLLVNRVNGMRQVRATLDRQFAQARPSIPRTQICRSIRLLSQRPRTSRGGRRTLILVSDMWENSSTARFYGSGGRPRMIDVAVELNRVRRANLLADLRAVDVYVIGLAIIPSGNRQYFQDEAIVDRLQRFWHAYFAASGASSVTIGYPILARDIP